MKIASITETKNQLSALLAEVRQGETVIIMDRGRPVARLEAVAQVADSDAGIEGRLAKLERDGVIHRSRVVGASRLLLSTPPKARKGASALSALLDEREAGR